MQIKIGENHRVITDPLNYILQADAKGVEEILNKLEQLEKDINNLEV